MNRSKSTISRELRRNSLNRADYLPDSAQLKMQQRREQSKHKFMSIRPSTIAQVKHRLQQYLRQGQAKRRRRGALNQKRSGIPGRVGIEQRPTIADQKLEIGHWESDTVIGGNHAGVVVTHVDKASKFLIAGLAQNKTVRH